MKIAIGMIVRNLISAHPLTDFLDNAEKYDHPIERVIVVYSHEADLKAIAAQDEGFSDPASKLRKGAYDFEAARRSLLIHSAALVLPVD